MSLSWLFWTRRSLSACGPHGIPFVVHWRPEALDSITAVSLPYQCSITVVSLPCTCIPMFEHVIMCIYIYIHVCVYTYIYIYIYTYIHVLLGSNTRIPRSLPRGLGTYFTVGFQSSCSPLVAILLPLCLDTPVL